MSPFLSNPAFPVLVLATAVFVAIAAGFDLRSRRIPNRLNYAMLGLGLVYQVTLTSLYGWGPLVSGLLGMLIGFGLMFVLWLVGGGGGGDVKLMAALGMWLGHRLILVVFLLSTGLVAALLLASTARRLALWGWHGFPKDGPATATRHHVPFAAPVAVATWMLLGWSVILPALRTLPPRPPLTDAGAKSIVVHAASEQFSERQTPPQ